MLTTGKSITTVFRHPEASCRTEGFTESIHAMHLIFFPQVNERPDAARLRGVRAKGICSKCSIRGECGDWAIENAALIGDTTASIGHKTVGAVYGGMTQYERHEIRMGRADRDSF